MMINGVWFDNITCPRCRKRHPENITCKYAKSVADENKEEREKERGGEMNKLSDRVRANSEAAPWVVDEIKQLEAALAELQHNLKNWGAIEIAIRNPAVAESMRHWECRAEKAEAELKALTKQEPVVTPPQPSTQGEKPIDVARRFHETYERLAPSFGYETRQDTKTFNPDSQNGKLMIAVCAELKARTAQEREATRNLAAAMFDAGFRAGADWSGEEHILHDMESFRYNEERNAAIDAALRGEQEPEADMERAAKICEDESIMQPLNETERNTALACATAIRDAAIHGKDGK